VQTTTNWSSLNGPLASAIGIVLVVLVIGTLSNVTAGSPLIGTVRGALIALLAVGMAMCAVGGIGPAQADLGWTHPVTLLGIALGTLIVLIAGAAVIGQAAFLVPVAAGLPRAVGAVDAVTGDRAAFLVITILILAKWLIAFGARIATAPATLGG
jgi:hypothetical protein